MVILRSSEVLLKVVLALSIYIGTSPLVWATLLVFLKCCLGCVRYEILGFFGRIYEQDTFERSLRASFMVLIPKKG